MSIKVLKTIFQFRRAMSAEWTAVNPVLRVGEPGYSIDEHKHKIGDGVTAWNDLDYQEGEDFVVNTKTHYDFPSVGKSNIIYKAESESMIYQWNSELLKYEPLGLGDGLSNVEIIHGGNANG